MEKKCRENSCEPWTNLSIVEVSYVPSDSKKQACQFEYCKTRRYIIISQDEGNRKWPEYLSWHPPSKTEYLPKAPEPTVSAITPAHVSS